MLKQWRAIVGIYLFALLSSSCTGELPERADSDSDIWFFVLVKSSNYAQDSSGELTRLNYHFFSEIFPEEGRNLTISGRLTRHDALDSPMPYVERKNNYYVEGGHFDSISELDAAFPNGRFRFEFSANGMHVDTELTLSGPDGETDLPEAIRISLFQNGELVAPLDVDPAESMTVKWSRYSNGVSGPNGILDDMIFVVVQDCAGDRIVHTGLPFKERNYMTYREKELVIEPGTMRPGEPYAMFVEFPHVVDSVVANGVPGFTSFATATYLDIETTGNTGDESCGDDMPPMDTGQTDR